MHLHHLKHRLAVGGEAVEGTDCCSEFGARAVGRSVQNGRDRPAEAPAGIAVIRQPVGHQQAAEIRVAQPQRPEVVAVTGDSGRWVARMVDQDLLGD